MFLASSELENTTNVLSSHPIMCVVSFFLNVIACQWWFLGHVLFVKLEKSILPLYVTVCLSPDCSCFIEVT